jgi:hypothetical protein
MYRKTNRLPPVRGFDNASYRLGSFRKFNVDFQFVFKPLYMNIQNNEEAKNVHVYKISSTI